MWTPTRNVTLYLEIGAAQLLSVTAVTEIAQKSALLCVNMQKPYPAGMAFVQAQIVGIVLT